MLKELEMLGKKAGRILVTEDTGERTRLDSVIWRGECQDCGEAVEGTRGHLIREGCNCEYTDGVPYNGKHGMCDTPEYYIWASMKQRCNNPACESYIHYGARGIRVCDDWNNDFRSFLKDMGKRPGKGYSIERKDPNKGYYPENCKWGTPKEQANNRRNTINKTGVFPSKKGDLFKPRLFSLEHGLLTLGSYSDYDTAKDVLDHMKTHRLFKGPSKKRENASSKYKGVCWLTGPGRWKAYHPRTGKSLGWHETEECARMAVEAYCREIGEEI